MGLLRNNAQHKAIEAQNQCGEIKERALESLIESYVIKTSGSYDSVICELENCGYTLSEKDKFMIKSMVPPSGIQMLEGIDDEDLASISDCYPGESKEIARAIIESENDIFALGLFNDKDEAQILLYNSINDSYKTNEALTTELDEQIGNIIEVLQTEW